jgi:penicillin V acylase-like amidase (Ntn superfamily)
MANVPIFSLLEKAAKFDIQFALLYFFYMKSLENINENSEFRVVRSYNNAFLKKIDLHFKFGDDEGLSAVFEEDEF